MPITAKAQSITANAGPVVLFSEDWTRGDWDPEDWSWTTRAGSGLLAQAARSLLKATAS